MKEHLLNGLYTDQPTQFELCVGAGEKRVQKPLHFCMLHNLHGGGVTFRRNDSDQFKVDLELVSP